MVICGMVFSVPEAAITVVRSKLKKYANLRVVFFVSGLQTTCTAALVSSKLFTDVVSQITIYEEVVPILNTANKALIGWKQAGIFTRGHNTGPVLITELI